MLLKSYSIGSDCVYQPIKAEGRGGCCHCVCVTMKQVYFVSLCTYHKPATPFFKCKVQLSNMLISTNLYPVPVVKDKMMSTNLTRDLSTCCEVLKETGLIVYS
jgi:hypothetical protein